MPTGSTSGAPSNRAGRERSTRQFQGVRDELGRSRDFRSAQDIHAAMRTGGASVGLATVYRALQTLVEAGTADAMRTDAGETVYRECGSTHHHHLVCRSCGRTIEVRGAAVETWADDVATRHGFAEVGHTLELSGICPPCQDAARRASPTSASSPR
ncbi:Fur family transcriptional regulator [uncultured Phycicoccus sp.]|uniref:Fur family transcriptional regulator n=1 Tax=uncultured Phycicoccus sp. TaxID=661422 RepID=UPI002619BF45|nr:transcriptional repressor [uncultured Phycicoccus sp.]